MHRRTKEDEIMQKLMRTHSLEVKREREVVG
jgi:hypothetical protein